MSVYTDTDGLDHKCFDVGPSNRFKENICIKIKKLFHDVANAKC